MSDSLYAGHAAWVWIDLYGDGARWHLAVPVEREDWAEVDEEDDVTCRYQAMFPLADERRMEIEDLYGCPERRVEYPFETPTAAELDACRRAAEAWLGAPDPNAPCRG